MPLGLSTLTLPAPLINEAVKNALLEDLGRAGDITTLATIPEEARAEAVIRARHQGVVAGMEFVRSSFSQTGPGVTIDFKMNDGAVIQPNDIFAVIRGPAQIILSAERVALNYLGHLSGIATATAKFVDRIKGTHARITCTRKTTPGLRLLEKKAVIHGGGINHRMDLASGMLIKENHIEGSGSISDAIHACFQYNRDVWVEVECETQDEVKEAVQVCPDIILLDNMTPEQVRLCRQLVPDSILLEASGNITLDNARLYAETGVNRIAIGAITHSATALDLSMLVQAIPMNSAANDDS
ncbi:MAG: nicotinate-nucleotide diphosphorylase (carboxylating) [Hyphomicrobiales bacterium]|nr:MAG: nicotinate-nucleotide diphosphorylase (carboxylating) [Hyphomicrobiales bacterium]